jgi:hypothetical protein
MLEKPSTEILGIDDPEIQYHLKQNPDQAAKLGQTLIEMDKERADRDKATEEMKVLGAHAHTFGSGERYRLHRLFKSKIFITLVILIFVILIIQAIVKYIFGLPGDISIGPWG